MEGASFVRRCCYGGCRDSAICWFVASALSFGSKLLISTKSTSLIRLGFLAVLPASNFLGTIGSISGQRHQRLLSKLSEYLQPKDKSDTAI
jgi:hypothetical protein